MKKYIYFDGCGINGGKLIYRINKQDKTIQFYWGFYWGYSDLYKNINEITNNPNFREIPAAEASLMVNG